MGDSSQMYIIKYYSVYEKSYKRSTVYDKLYTLEEAQSILDDPSIHTACNYTIVPVDTEIEDTRPPVNHYKRLVPEPIDVLEQWVVQIGWNKAQAIKYLARAGSKDGEPEAKDLNKAIDYIKRAIAVSEGRTGSWV